MKLPLKPPAVIAVILARFQYESALIEQTWIMELQYGSLPRWILQKKSKIFLLMYKFVIKVGE